MAYCTHEDVTDITGTQVDSAIIDRLITKADRYINLKLRAAGLTAITGNTPDEIIEASSLFAASFVLSRTLVNGATPESIKLENTTIASPILKTISKHKADGDAMLNAYIAHVETPDDPFVKYGKYKMFKIVGNKGVRVGSYNEMTDAEQEET